MARSPCLMIGWRADEDEEGREARERPSRQVSDAFLRARNTSWVPRSWLIARKVACAGCIIRGKYYQAKKSARLIAGYSRARARANTPLLFHRARGNTCIYREKYSDRTKSLFRYEQTELFG